LQFEQVISRDAVFGQLTKNNSTSHHLSILSLLQVAHFSIGIHQSTWNLCRLSNLHLTDLIDTVFIGLSHPKSHLRSIGTGVGRVVGKTRVRSDGRLGESGGGEERGGEHSLEVFGVVVEILLRRHL
jgi:hypothetical protein